MVYEDCVHCGHGRRNYCNEVNEKGLTCTLEPNHTGPHAACGAGSPHEYGDSHPIDMWGFVESPQVRLINGDSDD